MDSGIALSPHSTTTQQLGKKKFALLIDCMTGESS